MLMVSLQLAMAASETLHKFFHEDADQPGMRRQSSGFGMLAR